MSTPQPREGCGRADFDHTMRLSLILANAGLGPEGSTSSHVGFTAGITGLGVTREVEAPISQPARVPRGC